MFCSIGDQPLCVLGPHCNILLILRLFLHLRLPHHLLPSHFNVRKIIRKYVPFLENHSLHLHPPLHGVVSFGRALESRHHTHSLALCGERRGGIPAQILPFL